MGLLGDISRGAVGGLLGGIGTLAKDIRVAITGVDPVKAAEIELKLTELESQAMNAQAAINLEEAKSDNLFVSGWRPFIGWCGGFALAYSALFEPFMRFIAKVGFGYDGMFPQLDTAILGQVLMGILGLGVMRTYDKKQKPNPVGKE